MIVEDDVMDKIQDVEYPEKKELLLDFLVSIESPILVEGKNDRKILEYFGVTDIIELNKGASITETIEALQDLDSIIILTDFDKKGRQLYRKILSQLSMWGIREDRRPRNLFEILHLEHIEDLKSFKVFR